MTFDKKLFLQKLENNTFIKNAEWFKELNSSQETLISKINRDNAHDCLIGAEKMNNARGQYSRKYITSEKTGLYFSIAIPKENSPNIKQHIKLIMAIAIANSIKKLTNLNVKIKFPNDIYYKSKKISGILVEDFSSEAGENFLIIGVGMNVNESNFPLQIREKATSLKIESGFHVSRESLCAQIIINFGKLVENYKKYGMHYLKKEYSNHTVHHFIGKLNNGELINCHFVDLTDNGYLIVYSKERQSYYTFYYSDLIEINF